MFMTTRALVLREVKFKEADKLLTVLSEGEGKLTVRARGALRKGCKYGAAAQQLVFSELTLFGNKGRWSLNEGATLEEFRGLREDISLLALGSYVCELLETVSDEDSPNPEVLRLGLNTLYALSRGLCPKELARAVFEMRLMCLSGYGPALDACAVCGREEPAEPSLDLAGGALVCAGCAGGERARLCPDSLAALRHIESAEPKKIFSFSLSGEPMDRLSNACERYVRSQLERGFRTLDYYKSLF